MTDGERFDGDLEEGRQFERTSMAWWRTMLAAVAVGLLLVRQSESGFERWMASAGTLLALVLTAAVGYGRTRRLDRGAVADAGAGHRVMAALAAAVVLMEVIGLVLVV